MIEEPGPRHLLQAGPVPGRQRRQTGQRPSRHLDPAARLPQGPVRQGGSRRPTPSRRSRPRRPSSTVGHGRDRRRHQGRRRLHPADLRVLRPRQRLPAHRRPGQPPADHPAVRGRPSSSTATSSTTARTKGGQDADTTRAAYFAGKAGMIVWSSFLLDELAGLRNDALPTCGECRDDKTFLAQNSGVVTAIKGPAAPSRPSSVRSPTSRSSRTATPSRPRSSSST